jgi:Thermopsin
MGIADPGTGGRGGLSSTVSFLGEVEIDALSANNTSIPGDPDNASLQLNAFVEFDFSGTTFVYWVQTVEELDTENGSTSFFDNVWNATSSPLPEISSGAISGKGSVATFDGESYYGYAPSCAVPGACITLAYPANLTLRLNTSLSGSGQPEVEFAYDDGYGFQTFDTVRFVFATGLGEAPEFVVSASLEGASCPRCWGDVELIAGGPSGGEQTALNGTTEMYFGLLWWNGNNYEAVPDASDHGFATEEGMSNVTESVTDTAGGMPLAALENGPGALGTLWTPGSISSVEVSVDTGSSGGTLDIGATGSVAFSGTSVTVVLLPQSYDLSVVAGHSTDSLGTVPLTAGEELTLEVGAPAVVFVPTGLPSTTPWSVTLGSQTLMGTGNLTFGEAAGNYTYTVGSVSGYASSPAGGTVAVTASGATVPIDWKSTAKSWTQQLEALLTTPVGPVPLYVLLLLLVVVGIVAAAIAGRSSPPVEPWRPPPP